MMGQSTTNGNILELASVEHDIAQALTKSPPSRDQRAIGFPPQSPNVIAADASLR